MQVQRRSSRMDSPFTVIGAGAFAINKSELKRKK